MQRSALLFALVSVGCVDGMEAPSEGVEATELNRNDLRDGSDFDIISTHTLGNPAVGGGCLDAAGTRPVAGQTWWVQQFPCNGGLNQNVRLRRSPWQYSAWEIRSAADDSYCLDVPSSTYEAGVQLQFYKCNGGPNQSWWIEERDIDGPRFQIKPMNATRFCLDVRGAVPDGKSPIQLYTCSWNAPNQLWYFRKVLDRDDFYATGNVTFHTYTGQSSPTVAPGSVATFASYGGKIGISGSGTSEDYICDFGATNYSTNRLVVDYRTSTLKYSCMRQ